MYDFEANKVIPNWKADFFFKSIEEYFCYSKMSSSISISKSDCKEEQPDLLWNSKRAKREGACPDRKGDV